ncbi:MAG: GNAT family N-acyltransferase [Gammaproteobacteria bacterium]
MIAGTLDRLTALSTLNKMYHGLRSTEGDRDFLQLTLDHFRVQVEASARELSNIPRTGPVVVVANHPFGAIEGVIMAHVLRALRDDVRIMANGLLKQFTEIAHLFLDVNPFGGTNAARQNVRPLREAMRWVQQGGLLMVFPAGEVSSLRLDRRAISDPEWNSTVASIVRRSNASVVPVYIHGRNSALFYLVGLIHPRLRTILLPRELLNKTGQRIRLTIGSNIPGAQLNRFETDDEMTAFMRMRTYLLALPVHDDVVPQIASAAPNEVQDDELSVEPIIEPVPVEVVRTELESLPPAQTLVTSDNFRVVIANAAQIPWTLQEIGRLRELTFRAVGEGTGRGVDIDLFDDYYQHLFLWNAQSGEVAGAYRIGRADDILSRFGLQGLYTHSLFNYRRRVIEELQPALEVGRSFVRAEYQRSFTPLLLLWRGIGEYVVRNPRYATLYGPVSISNEYQPLSRALLVDYLKRTHLQADYARDVRPRNPFRAPWRRLWRGMDLAVFSGLDSVDELIAHIEPDGKGTPVLVRHYVKLGGRFLGFNVDDQFGSAIDGLVMVDLRRTEPRLLGRYMGKRGAQQFFEFHRHAATPAA